MCKSCKEQFAQIEMANDGHRVLLLILDPDSKDFTVETNLSVPDQMKAVSAHLGLLIHGTFPTKSDQETAPSEGNGI